MAQPKNTHFIITGGTIDSYYDGTVDTIVPNKKSVVPAFVRSLNISHKFKFTTVCMKDSRNLNETDLAKMLQEVENSTSTRIIITHGTYTMPDSARLLEAQLKRKDQVIIFTGSMIPIQGFSPSDGPFNLGYSFAQLDYLEPGVYVCMNGHVFAPAEVMKFLQKGKFVSVFGER